MDFRSRFGFHSTPFTREIRVEQMFTPAFIMEATRGLEGAIHSRMSGALIAPAGCGKPALLRNLVARLPEARYHCHYVKVTSLSKRDMCREIAHCMNLPPAGAYNALLRRIQESVIDTADTEGLRPVLILDEAQGLRPDVLEMLAPLTNFDMDSRLVLAVILAGQPRLTDLLRRPEFEGIARRLAHYATLRPLSREETAAYITHRSAVAGAVDCPFDERSIDAIYEIGRGNLRATDGVALKALELAAAKDVNVVDQMHVVEARKLLWP